MDSLFEVPYQTPLRNLAKSIELLDKADMVVFMKGFKDSRGCLIEYEIVKKYNKLYKILSDEGDVL